MTRPTSASVTLSRPSYATSALAARFTTRSPRRPSTWSTDVYECDRDYACECGHEVMGMWWRGASSRARSSGAALRAPAAPARPPARRAAMPRPLTSSREQTSEIRICSSLEILTLRDQIRSRRRVVSGGHGPHERPQAPGRTPAAGHRRPRSPRRRSADFDRPGLAPANTPRTHDPARCIRMRPSPSRWPPVRASPLLTWTASRAPPAAWR